MWTAFSSYAAAEQQLKDLNIDLKPKLAGETLEASDDDDEPTAGTKRRRCVRGAQ